MSLKLKARNLNNQLEGRADNELILQDGVNDNYIDLASEIDGDEDLLSMEIPPIVQSVTYEEGGERLVISHIVVENFKSYFGKRIIGPFHKVCEMWLCF
jgi:uncharacterized protein with ACT and thioredoxin-like domain